jgi:hypothetical protein
MLGDQIVELKGKIMSQRVLGVKSPTIEISVSLTGSIKGTPVKQAATYINRPTSSPGFDGKGQGIVMAGESEVATFTGEGFGRVDPSVGIKWRAVFFYRTTSTGKHFLTMLWEYLRIMLMHIDFLTELTSLRILYITMVLFQMRLYLWAIEMHIMVVCHSDHSKVCQKVFQQIGLYIVTQTQENEIWASRDMLKIENEPYLRLKIEGILLSSPYRYKKLSNILSIPCDCLFVSGAFRSYIKFVGGSCS